MLLKSKPQPKEQIQVPPVGIGGDSGSDTPPSGGVERSVLCRHGIHKGHFPVAGLTVAEARRTLSHLLNIDPEAVAVINGQIVPEDHVIGNDVSMLQFVKKSSVKGAA